MYTHYASTVGGGAMGMVVRNKEKISQAAQNSKHHGPFAEHDPAACHGAGFADFAPVTQRRAG